MSRRLAITAGALALAAGLPLPTVWAAVGSGSTFFQALPLDPLRFVLVAAPIGTGAKAQLNIYEQVRSSRPCFAVSGLNPAVVNPLLATFDFTGICSRYIDGNGYSLRVGAADLATSYRLSVQRTSDDTLLLALPTRAGAGPEMVVARSKGTGTGFLQLQFEPGWELKRRAFGGRALGHVYVFRDSWPEGTLSAAPATPVDPVATPPAPTRR